MAMNHYYLRLCSTLAALTIATVVCAFPHGHSRRAGKGPVRQNASQVAAQMAPGWNLGNTLEVAGGETAVQPVKTTQQLMDFVKAQGFRSVRIPCRWNDYCDKNGTIDARWMARVKQVVRYAMGSGLYVVLTNHVGRDSVDMARYKSLWRQIAVAFRSYDEHLLFAGLDEPCSESGSTPSASGQTAELMHYSQAFVEAVRATKGNNAKRVLLVKTVPADPSGSGHLMVEADNGIDTPDYAMLKKTFADNGIPVVIGKLGSMYLSEGQCPLTGDAELEAWYKDAVSQAICHGCIPMVWDAGINMAIGNAGKSLDDAEKAVGGERKSTGDAKKAVGGVAGPFIIDRSTLSVVCQPLLRGVAAGVAAAQWPAE